MFIGVSAGVEAQRCGLSRVERQAQLPVQSGRCCYRRRGASRKRALRRCTSGSTLFGCALSSGPEQEPPLTASIHGKRAVGSASESAPDELTELRRLHELFCNMVRRDLEQRYGKEVAEQWASVPPDEEINLDNPRFQRFLQELVENEGTLFANEPLASPEDLALDQQVAAFLAEHAEKLGLDGPPKKAADFLPPRSTLRQALQQYRQQLGQTPGRDPTFRRADWPPQVLSFEKPRLAHEAWNGWSCRYDVTSGSLIERKFLHHVRPSSLLPEEADLVPLELESPETSSTERDSRYDWCMPFGTVVFPDGSYTGGVPAVHVESAVGRHYVPPAHTPFELNFGFVIPSEQAERCGCSSGLLDVAVEYRERAAVAVRVRWLTPVSRATASTSQGWLQVSDAFSARMLGTSTPSTTNAAEQKATSVLERIQFPSEEESAFCIFPLYPQMPCCWHASQVSLEPIDSRPVAPETLSRFEVDLDRSSFEDPDLTGSDIQLLRTPRSMKLKGRKGRLGRTIEALLAREAARTAPCTHRLRRSIARFETVDGLYVVNGDSVCLVPNVEEGFVARRLLHLPGGLVCMFPERIPRMGFVWDSELWFWGPAVEKQLEESQTDRVSLSKTSFRRILRSYSALGDFVAGCATLGA